jgi:hypothetical protein
MAPVFLKFCPKNNALGLSLLAAALCLFAGSLGFARVLIPQEAGAIQGALAKMHNVQRALNNLASRKPCLPVMKLLDAWRLPRKREVSVVLWLGRPFIHN